MQSGMNQDTMVPALGYRTKNPRLYTPGIVIRDSEFYMLVI